MCGIFGGIGETNPAIIRALAIANKARGKDSLGFFNSTGQHVKRAGDPIALLATKEFGDFIDARGWFIAGHTRQATQGKVCDENAHPFRYGRFIGAHNGIVEAPLRFDVDSQYLFYRLKKCKGDYQRAFNPVDGWWGLSWFDGAEFYLQSYGNAIALGRVGQAYYYSSDEAHLRAAVGGLSDVIILEWGDTVKFACDCKPQFCAGFCPTFDEWEGYVSGKSSVRIGDIGDEWREFYANRADFCESWEEYCGQYDTLDSRLS
jgi:hypothetical protein